MGIADEGTVEAHEVDWLDQWRKMRARAEQAEAERDAAMEHRIYLDAHSPNWRDGEPQPPPSIYALGAPEDVAALQATIKRGRDAEHRARIAEEDADRLAVRIRNHLLTLAWSKMRPIDHDEVESTLAAHDKALKARQ